MMKINLTFQSIFRFLDVQAKEKEEAMFKAVKGAIYCTLRDNFRCRTRIEVVSRLNFAQIAVIVNMHSTARYVGVCGWVCEWF